MPILILKTALNSDQNVDAIRPILNLHPGIKNWHVDIEDVDKVLRIESVENLSEQDIIQLLAQFNIASEILKN